MRVAIVSQNKYPCGAEVRITKMATSLLRAGADVSVLCAESDAAAHQSPGCAVGVRGMRPASHTPIHRALSAALPLNLLWTLWCARQFRRLRTEVVIVRSLRLFLPVWLAAKAQRLPVVFDLSEYFPAMNLIVGKSLWRKLTAPAFAARYLETLAVKLSDQIWVVVEEQVQRLKRYSDASRFRVISNTPIVPERHVQETFRERSRTADQTAPVRLGYVGYIDPGRGIQSVIAAIPRMRKPEQIRLDIVGDGSYRRDLEDMTRSLRLQNTVSFLGWIEPGALEAKCAAWDAGLIPHYVNAFTNHTIPNKLFDYMLWGKAVIATPMAPVVRVIRETGCGVVMPDDVQGIAGVLDDLVDDPSRLVDMGLKGQEAVRAKYNWGRDGSIVLESLRCLTAEPLRRASRSASTQ